MSKNSSVLNTNTNKVRYPQFEWKFKIQIRGSEDGQFFYVGVSPNRKDLFQCETQKRKSQVIKTANNLFPGVTIIDKTTAK